ILAGAHAAAWPISQHPTAAETFCANHLGMILYGALLLAAFCTAFYMFRLYFLVFEGEFRGTPEQEHHLHESPPAMIGVLWVLAIGSIVVGFTGMPDALHEGWDRFGEWLGPTLPPQSREETAKGFLAM